MCGISLGLIVDKGNILGEAVSGRNCLGGLSVRQRDCQREIFRVGNFQENFPRGGGGFTIKYDIYYQASAVRANNCYQKYLFASKISLSKEPFSTTKLALPTKV